MTEAEELELLELENKNAMAQKQSPPAPSFQDQIPGILKQAGQAALATSPANLTRKFMETDPGTMTRMAGPGLPIVGGMAGLMSPVPGGAAAGAMMGEGIHQSMASAFAPETGAKTIPGQLASIAATGVMQEPKILNEIPGVSKVGQMAGNMMSKIGKGAAKFGEALTGAKAKDLEQAAKQGLSTYGAPSMEKAQGIFGAAMEKAGISAKPPIEHIIDPQLQTARETAIHVGTMLDEGIPLTAQEALLGRQAVDRIYTATSVLDRSTRGHLADLRTMMDKELSEASGPLKEASTTYRKAIVKSNLLTPFKMTKQGQMSAVAPMVATLAASAGVGSGNKGKSGLGALGYLAASSPAIAGAIATSGGSGAQVINAIAQNPAARQALLQVLQRIRQGSQPTQEAP